VAADFIILILLAVLLWGCGMTLGVWLALWRDFLPCLCGMLLLGLAMAHGVELQHQALHHTPFHYTHLRMAA